MVDAARAILDELMGRNRNLNPSEGQKISWEDPEFCEYYMVKFCPHDLFVNTRADLGACLKLHDDEAKEMYTSAANSTLKRRYEDDFLKFCNKILSDIERKIEKGKQRLLLLNKTESASTSSRDEELNTLDTKIKQLLSEAEEAGLRGDVDLAQDLITQCEKLQQTREYLDSNKPNGGQQEKQMEVCKICGAFLVIGDAKQRMEDHLMGKQHIGYSLLRNTVEEFNKKRSDEEDSRKSEYEYKRRNNKSYETYDNSLKYDNYQSSRQDSIKGRDRSHSHTHHRRPHQQHSRHSKHRSRSRSYNRN